MSVLQQTVSLAAQLRAFSSLLSLPSQAQSVIIALRRQGIGSADECLILPAFSSPDLKAFPLCSKSSKSSAGGQGETVSSVSAFFQLSLRSSLQEAATPATDSPDTRFSIGVLVVLSECLCLWWKGPYLPYQPLSVRHLPRTTSLPPMAFVASFRICLCIHENRPQTP